MKLSGGAGAGAGHYSLQSNPSLTNLAEAAPSLHPAHPAWPRQARMSAARSTNDLDQLAGAGAGVVMTPGGGGGVVPPYRPAPDYETAMLSKFGEMSQLYSSQPSLHPGLQQLAPAPAPAPLYLSPVSPVSGFPLTTAHTYSTPELNTAGGGGAAQPRAADLHNRSAAPLTVFTQQRVYSPAPPPYLPPAAISSSTPDLASQASLMAAAGAGAGQGGVVGVGGSSPDLVSRCVN